MLDAHCRHLGAHLGIGGRVEGDGIRCPFHAWLWNGAGDCTEIPYAKRIPPNAKMRSWPLCEKNGVSLVFHHAEDKPPTWEVPELPQIGASGWRPLFVQHWTVRARWLDMNENCVDQAHFRYIHGTLSIPRTDARIDEGTTDVSFAYTVKTEGDERKERLAQAVVQDLLQQFENDRPIWESKASWAQPRLCDGDGPLGVYRKWMQQFF